jgi:hypothetical protein
MKLIGLVACIALAFFFFSFVLQSGAVTDGRLIFSIVIISYKVEISTAESNVDCV